MALSQENIIDDKSVDCDTSKAHNVENTANPNEQTKLNDNPAIYDTIIPAEATTIIKTTNENLNNDDTNDDPTSTKIHHDSNSTTIVASKISLTFGKNTNKKKNQSTVTAAKLQFDDTEMNDRKTALPNATDTEDSQQQEVLIIPCVSARSDRWNVLSKYNKKQQENNNNDVDERAGIDPSKTASSSLIYTTVTTRLSEDRSIVIKKEQNDLGADTTEIVLKQEVLKTEDVPNTILSDDDQKAAEAILSSVAAANKTSENTNSNIVIPTSATSTLQRKEKDADQEDIELFQADLKVLPDAIPVTSDVYEKIPISQFGAAMLRGMGWKDDESDPKKKESEQGLPRPHRLGLGAIPKLNIVQNIDNGDGTTKKKIRRQDQYQRDQVLKQTQQQYEQQSTEQQKVDRQKTLQDGSIVYLFNDDMTHNNRQHRRAKILQLVGVPGLNQVKVQLEDTSSSSTTSAIRIIKRNQIDRLVPRDELERYPFQEQSDTTQTTSVNDDNDRSSDEENRRKKSAVTERTRTSSNNNRFSDQQYTSRRDNKYDKNSSDSDSGSIDSMGERNRRDRGRNTRDDDYYYRKANDQPYRRDNSRSESQRRKSRDYYTSDGNTRSREHNNEDDNDLYRHSRRQRENRLNERDGNDDDRVEHDAVERRQRRRDREKYFPDDDDEFDIRRQRRSDRDFDSHDDSYRDRKGKKDGLHDERRADNSKGGPRRNHDNYSDEYSDDYTGSNDYKNTRREHTRHDDRSKVEDDHWRRNNRSRDSRREKKSSSRSKGKQDNDKRRHDDDHYDYKRQYESDERQKTNSSHRRRRSSSPVFGDDSDNNQQRSSQRTGRDDEFRRKDNDNDRKHHNHKRSRDLYSSDSDRDTVKKTKQTGRRTYERDDATNGSPYDREEKILDGRGDVKEKRSSSSRHNNTNRDDHVGRSKQSGSNAGANNSNGMWVIPNIRVRIVTDRYGQQYNQQTGIVIDVTTQGVTVEMETSNHIVLDYIPERYVQATIPKKIGQPIVVLNQDSPFYSLKGKLLESSNDGRTIIVQFLDEMNVASLSYDDTAEWCGPIEE